MKTIIKIKHLTMVINTLPKKRRGGKVKRNTFTVSSAGGSCSSTGSGSSSSGSGSPSAAPGQGQGQPLVIEEHPEVALNLEIVAASLSQVSNAVAQIQTGVEKAGVTERGPIQATDGPLVRGGKRRSGNL